MAVSSSIVVDLTTKTTGWTKGLSDGGKQLQGFVRNAESQFKSLTGQKGGAAFADALKAAATGAADLATKLRTGEMSYGDLANSVINKIPIVGQFKQAGEAIRELIWGTKAAAVEMAKATEHAQKMVDAYRQLAAAEQLRGKYGQERQKIEADQGTNANITKLHADREALTKSLQEIEKKDFNVGWYSDAQKKEMARIRADLKINDAQVLSARKDGNQKQKDLARENAQEQLEFDRSMNERVESNKAAMEEKSLRRHPTYTIHYDVEMSFQIRKPKWVWKAPNEGFRGYKADGTTKITFTDFQTPRSQPTKLDITGKEITGSGSILILPDDGGPTNYPAGSFELEDHVAFSSLFTGLNDSEQHP